MGKNKLIIAAAGSGKTTLLVKKALSIQEKNVLITTYTEANEAEIKKKIVEQTGGYVPENIALQTWFSFLLRHGVRPFQGIMHHKLRDEKIGFFLTDRPSGLRYKNSKNQPIYWGEQDFLKYYFTSDLKIYSDKISKFLIECNEKTEGSLIDRISSLYPYIFIDEVQDLAGWDLEIIKLLFKSPSNIILVGDPRQVTYLTHHPKKYPSYANGNIREFIDEKCKKVKCEIDEVTLSKSHRNNLEICNFSSRLFPEYECSQPCEDETCRSTSAEHQGIFLVKNQDIEDYLQRFDPVILRYNNSISPEWNFGKSKGMTFERVLIYPTQKILAYLKSGDQSEIETVRAKFYVALTRARRSAAIVCDYDDSNYIEGIQKYSKFI